MIIFNEEYKRLLEEKMQLDDIKFFLNKPDSIKVENEDEINENIELFFIRLSLKKTILKLIATTGIDVNNIFKELNYFSKCEEIEIFKEYREYFKKNTNLFPTFIFDNYCKLNFEKCMKYRKAGHTLNQIEEYYINEVKDRCEIIL